MGSAAYALAWSTIPLATGHAMSLAVVNSRALCGMDAPSVSVEVHLANGLPAFTKDELLWTFSNKRPPCPAP